MWDFVAALKDGPLGSCPRPVPSGPPKAALGAGGVQSSGSRRRKEEGAGCGDAERTAASGQCFESSPSSLRRENQSIQCALSVYLVGRATPFLSDNRSQYLAPNVRVLQVAPANNTSGDVTPGPEQGYMRNA